jgi:membrane protease YdiL (CAAX protease family)
MPTAIDFILNFLMIAVVAPVAEELLFRGTLQQLLQRAIRAHWAIIITGAVFSFTHGDLYGFLPRWLLGILLGYMFFMSRNLWVPIFAHFLFNGLQVVMVFLFQQEASHVNIEEESFTPQVTMLATILLFATLYIFDRIANRSKPEDGERLGESVLDD